jgi:segregation and condensation protein A
LPKPPAELVSNDEDAGEQLARQLYEYRCFKQAAAQLRAWEAEGRRSFARTAPPPLPPVPPAPPAPLQIGLHDLVALVERRLKLIAAQADAVPLPVPKVVTIADVRERVYDVLATQHWFSFEDLLSFSLTRNEVIVTLWTVLELFKRQVITFEQRDMFGTITIGRGALFAGREVWNDEGNTERE